MAQLNDKDILLDALIDVGSQETLKKGAVLGKTANSRELMLEEAPNVVRLESSLLFAREEDLPLENLIVLFGILVERTHLGTLDESVLLVRGILEHLEETLTLIVISLWLVSQLDEDVDVRCSCRVHVVETTFGHLGKHIVQLRLHELVFDLVEVVQSDVVQGCHEVCLEGLQLRVGGPLGFRRLLLHIVGKVLLFLFGDHLCFESSVLGQSS